ncbi:MAG: sigma-70 family RNA polymerase sigma factor [Arcobacteraceae bacterium]|nr:sigma-70 family RNA polymerase sigma factor [Arcobacteraceae bacterium]
MLEHYNEIAYYIQKLTGDKVLAKDLTQETYVKVLEVHKNSNAVIQKAYLYKIAQNLVIDKVRRDKILIQTSYDEEEHVISLEDSPEEIISEEIRKNKLKECIQTLSAQNKKAFVLHYYKGYTRKEIGEILGISTNAVEKNITRAVLKIKEQMKKDYE